MDWVANYNRRDEIQRRRAHQRAVMEAMRYAAQQYRDNQELIHRQANRARNAVVNLNNQRQEAFLQRHEARMANPNQGNLRGGVRNSVEVTPARKARGSLIRTGEMSRKPIAVSLQAKRQHKYRNVKKHYGSAAHRMKELYDTFFPKATYLIHAQCKFNEFSGKVSHINTTGTAINSVDAGQPKSFGCIVSQTPWQGIWTTTFRNRAELEDIWKQGFNMFPNTAMKLLTSKYQPNAPTLIVGQRLDQPVTGISVGGTDSATRIALIAGSATSGATNITTDWNDSRDQASQHILDPRSGGHNLADVYETTALLQDSIKMEWVNATEAAANLEIWELMPKFAHNESPEAAWKVDLDRYGLATYLATPDMPADTLVNGADWNSLGYAEKGNLCLRDNGATATYTGKHDLAYRIGTRPHGKNFNEHWRVCKVSKMHFDAGETGTYVTNLPPIRDAGAAYRNHDESYLPGITKVFMFFCKGERRLFTDDTSLAEPPPGSSTDHIMARVTTMSTQCLLYHKYVRSLTFQGAPSRRKNQYCTIGNTFTSPTQLAKGYVDKPGYIITPFPLQVENDGAHGPVIAMATDGIEAGTNS